MTRFQRLVLFVSILASFVALLDGSVVNVALPAISRELGGGLATQEWVVDAYLLALGSLILLAGSLSDLFGRLRILLVGLLGFGAASLVCAIAPTSLLLIVARAVQGMAGALLVPSSLALIMTAFNNGAQEGQAIGRWTAWTGMAFVVGPLLGGFLVDTLSWRWVFAINVVPIAVCLWLLHHIRSDEHKARAQLDTIGAVLCSLGLSSLVFGLIEQPQYGWQSPLIAGTLLGGVVLLTLFIGYEARQPDAMLPLSLFRIRNFTAGNIATLGIYGGLSMATFLIIIYLQQVAGFRALQAGLALLPVTLIMFFLSPRFGALADKFGPRFFMTVGPFLAACGFLLMLRVSVPVQYWSALLPGLVVFALGLATTVAPLTTAVLRDVSAAHSGVASAVNNAVARIAGLITTAIVGVVVGTHLAQQGFQRALVLTAFLLTTGGVTSWVGIRNRHNH